MIGRKGKDGKVPENSPDKESMLSQAMKGQNNGNEVEADQAVKRYLSEVGNQMRNQRAREYVTSELESHIEEQAQAYLDAGEEEQTAYEKAVREMGDPVDVGISFDRIHRPHLEWKFLILMALVSMCSLLLSLGLEKYFGDWGDYFPASCIYLVLGIGVMFLMYRLDYSFIRGKSALLAFSYLVILAAAVKFWGDSINGNLYLHFMGNLHILGVHSIAATELMMLYLPLFAGVLYDYRGKRKWTYFKLFFFFAAPVWLMMEATGSFGMMAVMFLSESVLMVLAMKKGWYQIRWKWVVPVGALLFVCMIVLCFHPKWILREYRYQRFTSWINGYEGEDYGYGYLPKRIKGDMDNSRWFGASQDIGEKTMPDVLYAGDYLIAGITISLGKAAALTVIFLLAAVSIYIFTISVRQKNQLGMMMGISCGMVLLIKMVLHIAAVFDWVPFTPTLLPFVSYGGSNVILSYALAGIVLSIFRYKDILEPENAVGDKGIDSTRQRIL